MTDFLFSFFQSLNAEQRRAVFSSHNAVVTAGAGSGKTKVISARYIHLVVERAIPVERIVVLTFTRKAAMEMARRIYEDLRLCVQSASAQPEPGHEAYLLRAREALARFGEARIMTLDAFSHEIARVGARFFGIAPDFSLSEEENRALAHECAEDFFLEHREHPVVLHFLQQEHAEDCVRELFFIPLQDHGILTHPCDFRAGLAHQIATARGLLKTVLCDIHAALHAIRHHMQEADAQNALIARCVALFAAQDTAFSYTPAAEADAIADAFLARGYEEYAAKPDEFSVSDPDEGARRAAHDCLRYCAAVKTLFCLKGNLGGRAGAAQAIKAQVKQLRLQLVPQMERLHAFFAQVPFLVALSSLLERLQARFIRQKRERNCLSHADVAHLAVQVLRQYPEIRVSYKRGIDAFMIDEFQDNNALQKELLFFLAEHEARTAHFLPPAHALCAHKLFFVGDEKQSIYAFRGADVRVFRALAGVLTPQVSGASKQELPLSAAAELQPTLQTLRINYRTEAALLERLNILFSHILRGPSESAENGYEVGFQYMQPARCTAGIEPQFRVIGVDRHRFSRPEHEAQHSAARPTPQAGRTGASEDSEDSLSAQETEAWALARAIRAMVDGGTLVRHKGEAPRACTWADVVILLRSADKQSRYERALRLWGIPYTSLQTRGMFCDAPLSDLLAPLRLVLEPADRHVYAQVLRGPFVRVDDDTLSLLLLPPAPPDAPFSYIPAELSAPAARCVRAGADFFARVQQQVRRLATNTELLTYLWYTEAYGTLLAQDPLARPYHVIYDYAFELARRADRQGKGIGEFLDFVDACLSAQERVEELELPCTDRACGAVQIMSVHKSKGLEFPIVCVPDAGSSGPQVMARVGAVHSPYGYIPRFLPHPEGVHPIFVQEQDTRARAYRAELRRVLYVAFTRAECHVIVSGVLPISDGHPAPAVSRSLADICSLLPSGDGSEPPSSLSFFSELLPALMHAAPLPPHPSPSVVPAPVSFDECLPLARPQAYQRALTGSARQSVPQASAPRDWYAAVPVRAPHYYPRLVQPVTSLVSPAPGQNSASASPSPLTPQSPRGVEFGTHVHELLAQVFQSPAPTVALHSVQRVDSPAARLVACFLHSPLGCRACAAPAHQRFAEFSFLTRAPGNTKPPHGAEYQAGTIDLLFLSNGVWHLVDYKTDYEEHPARYLPQLQHYARAVQDLFSDHPVTAFLYYLRTGHEFSLEALESHFLKKKRSSGF
ncbi:UvrD-helicase domain-containing protein [Treponema pallidum]|uniref:UvrD-helicase domain-containing protein n=2 Tax=Treponema pallidum TaxID=160 RepID=UPI000D548C47|nr:exodeoxyribonuclease V subunit beta [Treponema pallidum]AWG41766.1 exodeoxyribonuclease V beta subunit [Treponema pallidum subsp. pertenue]WGK71371.1 exodeoxyribonuclease V beta subunit [Treponema pallidum subsp. pertenue]WGK74290.1 exodeoxyribonuclease V beta subunit [Treponema pallidum subsp. pertenue]WGK75263.1 exodeoxyribonuclease V beta subunit [Treponema pallidum subsp. pertenue]